ncbi:MAG: hypothetical protein D6705_09900 [Deltaproteobacteria bacterium]|nr:MAG: hypothetical protein D6705_09900 [Deltaproteobacteria bacterium]
MLVRAGLSSTERIEAAREHARRTGTTVVEALAATGALEEGELAAFLQSRLLIPAVDAQIFDQVPAEVTDLLDAALAHRLGAFPVSLDDQGNLTVALVDPTDGAVVDEIAAATGKYVVRAVAPASELRSALARRYGSPPASQPSEPSAPAGGVVAPAAPAASDEPAAAPPTVDASAPGAASAAPQSATAAWEPPLASADDEPEPLSAEAFGRVIPRIVAAQTREDITRLVLDFLGAGFRRVILFVHAHGELRGREARGDDLDLDAVRLVRIPASEPSVFSKVITSKRPYFGPLRSETAIDRAFSAAFGGLTGNILVLPVLLRDKVPVLIFASGTSYPVDPRSIQELADGVSGALERLILRQKTAG